MKKSVLLTLLMTAAILMQAQTIPAWKVTDLEKFIAGKNQPVIINFWATFCKPCLHELPYFIQQAKEAGIPILLVSLDMEEAYPKKMEQFVKKQNWNTPIAWLHETNADYFCPRVDKSWSGSIPATLFINPATGYRKFVEEEMTEADFVAELKALQTAR